MDPVTVGAAVAVLAGSKLAEKIGEEAGESGWGLAKRIVGRVRDWFKDDDQAAAALEVVERAASPSTEDLGKLAALVDQRLDNASRVAGELRPLVDTAERDAVLGPVLRSVAGPVMAQASTVVNQSAVGERIGQVGTAGGDVTMTFGRD